MKKLQAQLGVLLAVLAAFAVSVGPADAQRKRQDAVGQIRAVLDRQVEAWNRQDLEGFMNGYWRSPELTFYSGGTRTTGWDSTLDRYRKSYQSEGREMGRLEFSELKIEMLGPEGAFVRGRWRLKMSLGEPNGLFTLIFRKLPGGWKIVHDHTSSAP